MHKTFPLVSSAVALISVFGLAPSIGHAGVPAYTCASSDNSVALNGLLANGGDIEVAAGVCPLANTLYVTVSGTKLNGAGMGKTVFVASSPLKFDMIQLGMATATYHSTGITVSNLSLNASLTTHASLSSSVGGGVIVTGGVSYSLVSNVEAYNGLNGFRVVGSYDTLSNVYSHNNRRAGIYVAGNVKLAKPFADHDVVAYSDVENNTLDNTIGKTWDDINFDVLSSNGFIAYNKVVGGDILIADTTTPGGIGGFTVSNNMILKSPLMNFEFSGIRLFGNVHDTQVTNNLLNDDQGTGINLVGHVTRAKIDANTIQGGLAYGIHVFPLVTDNNSVGDQIEVGQSNISMIKNKNFAISILGATNVTLQNNVGNGAGYDTSQAGTGLVATANH